MTSRSCLFLPANISWLASQSGTIAREHFFQCAKVFSHVAMKMHNGVEEMNSIHRDMTLSKLSSGVSLIHELSCLLTTKPLLPSLARGKKMHILTFAN
jgi:hypothetical protein